MQYKIILFDLDDTLIDFAVSQKKGLQQVHQQFYADLNFDHFETHFKSINYALWREVHKIPASEIRKLRFEQLNQAIHHHPEVETVAETYEQALGIHGIWFPNVEDSIRQLHQAGYIMGVITNGLSKTQRVKYQTLLMDKWFDCFIISDEAGMVKPDKAIFALAHEELAKKHGSDIKKINPKSTLMVGDSLHSDGQGAHNAGLSFCWIAHKSAVRQDGIPVDHHYTSVAELAKILC
jgi:2-haloacid dehalogenase